MSKIGLGIVTYNRVGYLMKCLMSLEKNNWGGADHIVIVDDGSTDRTKAYLEDLDKNEAFKKVKIIIKEENKGVANSKNIALKHLKEDRGCDHLFLMEDDITMIHPNTCNEYIKYAEKNKLQHMNFALHGDMNTGAQFIYWEKEPEEEAAQGITVYPNCVGAFSYYTSEVIDVVGYMDEELVNAWEHVWHTLQIADNGYTTPFWFFVDHPVSHLMLKEIPDSINNSIIRPREDWQENILKGKAYLIQKYGRFLPERPY